MSIINQNPDECLKDISRPVTDLINKALEVYERWDRWFEGLFKQEKIKKSHVRFSRSIEEQAIEPGLIRAAQFLITDSKVVLTKMRNDYGENDETVIDLSDQVVQIVINLVIKHINNHEIKKNQFLWIRRNDIGRTEPNTRECKEVLSKINSFLMTEKTRKRYKENYKIVSKNLKNEQSSNTTTFEDLLLQRKVQQPLEDDGCYIATMVYGDYEHPQVLVLRGFRDGFLAHSLLGRSFIRFYYKYSPSWVKALENNRLINQAIKRSLNQFIKLLK